MYQMCCKVLLNLFCNYLHHLFDHYPQTILVAVLSTVQIVSWGVLYYAFAALQSSITAETGWSSLAITGAFSLSQFVSGGVGIWVGRHIDDVGPRKVMTGASLVALSLVYSMDAMRTVQEVRALREALPREIPLLLGGAAATRMKDRMRMEGVRVGERLSFEV